MGVASLVLWLSSSPFLFELYPSTHLPPSLNHIRFYLTITVAFPVPFITCVLTAVMKCVSITFNAISKANLVYALFTNADMTENKMD